MSSARAQVAAVFVGSRTVINIHANKHSEFADAIDDERVVSWIEHFELSGTP